VSGTAERAGLMLCSWEVREVRGVRVTQQLADNGWVLYTTPPWCSCKGGLYRCNRQQ
jgi:hypothetical protein